MPYDNTSSTLKFATGLALANPQEQDAKVSLVFTNDAGAPVASGNVTVPAHGHYTAVLNDVFPATRGMRGVVQLNSDTLQYGLGIRFNGGAYTSIRTIAPKTN